MVMLWLSRCCECIAGSLHLEVVCRYDSPPGGRAEEDTIVFVAVEVCLSHLHYKHRHTLPYYISSLFLYLPFSYNIKLHTEKNFDEKYFYGPFTDK